MSKGVVSTIMLILFAAFIAVFVAGAVQFGVHFDAIEAARQVGETADEFRPIIWLIVAECFIGGLILILYLKHFAFDFSGD